MNVVRYWCSAAAFMALITFRATGGGDVTFDLQTTVTDTTCDVRLARVGGDLSSSMNEVNLGRFTGHDFKNNRVRLVGEDALVMYIPERECAGKNLRVKVEGPMARGSQGRAWGEHRRALAWGMRLGWAENGVTGRYPLTPLNNTLDLSVPSGRLQHAGNAVHTLVLRPELKTWDHRHVVAGVAQTVPLVFSVMYD
ncbi:hypothetical protein BFS14_14975 [Serratia fonticola]|nr:hypothetical protein BFS14_14975 [Serratia fonticola]